jgi:hypothetical protein
MTADDRKKLVDAAKAYSEKKQRDAQLAAGEAALRAHLKQPDVDGYSEWQESENKKLLMNIIDALKANPKLAAEIKILLRGDRP